MKAAYVKNSVILDKVHYTLVNLVFSSRTCTSAGSSDAAYVKNGVILTKVHHALVNLVCGILVAYLYERAVVLRDGRYLCKEHIKHS